MATTFTLRGDNQAGQSFDELVADLERVERQTVSTTKSAEQLAHAQARQSVQLSKNTQAWLQNQRWMQRSTEEQATLTEMIDRQRESVDRLAGSLVTRYGPALAKVALPAAAAGAAIYGVTKAMDETGEKIVSTSGVFTEESRKMADAINNGSVSIEEATKRAGKSLDEMGLKVETNFDRAKASVAGLIQQLGNQSGFNAAMDSMGASIDETVSESTRNFESLIQAIRRTMDEIAGIDFRHREQQEAALTKADQIRTERERYEELEAAVDDNIARQRELDRIGQVRSRNEIQRLLELAQAEKKRLIDNQQDASAASQRIIDLKQREYQLEKEIAANNRAAIAREAEQRRQAAEERNRLVMENYERQKAITERWGKLQAQIGQHQLDLVHQERDQRLQMMQERLQQAKQMEEQRLRATGATDDQIRRRTEKFEDAMLRVRKNRINEAARARVEAAETEEEKVRVMFEREKQLREADFQHKVDMERRKVQASIDAKQKEVEAEQAKVQRIMGLQNPQGQNLYESIAGGFSRQQVLDQIIQRRQQQAAAGKDLSRGERGRLNRQVRVQTTQQAMQGNIGQAEFVRAQGSLVNQVAKQGGLNQAYVRALGKSYEVAEKNARETDELRGTVTQLEKNFNNIQQMLQNSGQRTRAIRARIRR